MPRLFKPLLAVSVVLAAALVLAEVASAAPQSLLRGTQTGRTRADLQRAALLADAARSSSDELYKRLLLISEQDCGLAPSCHHVATQIVAPLSKAFENFSALARWYEDDVVDQMFMNALRTTVFDPVARLQHALHRSYALPTSGDTKADLACQDLLNVYHVLMNQVVARNQLGIGDGHGVD